MNQLNIFNKVEIKKVIINILTPLGYPKINPQIVFDNLLKIHIKLLEEKLIPTSLIYENFKNEAMFGYLKAQLKN
jgi:hypothetical protein